MEDDKMNRPEFHANPTLSENRIRNQWPDMCDGELDRIDGRPDRLYHALIQKYGISRDEAAQQLWDFVKHTARRDSETVSSNI
ncbi:MAG: hypothetical protein DWQ29_03245 [Planctomycetota bacterium]|nr:MAG: hypothetical protein DWQ29_03245 [Planctomycetota bacterium]